MRKLKLKLVRAPYTLSVGSDVIRDKRGQSDLATVVIQKSTGTPAPGESTTSQAGASLPIAGTMPLPEPRPSLETKVADAVERMISKVRQHKSPPMHVLIST